MVESKTVSQNNRDTSVFQRMHDGQNEVRQKAQEQMTQRMQKDQEKLAQRSKNSTKTYSWTGKSTNQMNTLEKVAYLRNFGNNDTARAAFSALSQEMQTVGSRHYSPYSTGKSNQKEAMDFFGLDSFDQDWLDQNRFLLNYTTQLDFTDSISTSGQAKWTDAQKAGYYYQMLSEAEETTKAAENEWTQLRSNMQKNFNEYKKLYGEAPSYEMLMEYIDMSDYSTLQKMDKVYENVEDLVRLNRSVEYTPETMLGVYAALLNGKDVTGDGDWFEEAVQYTMKPVQKEQPTQERANYSGWTQDQIEAKRQEIRKNGTRADLAQFEADLYASTPHLDSVDSTSYFKDTYYDQAFLDKYAYLGEYAEQLRNKDGKIEKPAASDPWWYQAAYEYNQIQEREEGTQKAEKEWAALRKSLQSSYNEEDDPQNVLDSIDWDKYPTLEKLRNGQKVDLNREVYFSDDAILGVLKAAADGVNVDNDDFDYAFYESKPEINTSEEEKEAEEPEKEQTEQALSSTYFQGPSAYDGKIEGYDYEPAYDEKEPDIQEPPTKMNPEDFTKEEPYQFDPEKYFQGPSAEVETEEVVDPEQVKQERQSFMDDLWQDMTANTRIDATMIEKAFYEANGRPMTQEERVQAGLAPRSLEEFDPTGIQLGVMQEQKQSIFDDTFNSIASRYENPKTGESYENMDELIANDPALLSNMLNYIETEPRQQEFSTTEVEHLKLLKQYQDDLDRGTLDEMFRAYADENATDEDRLNGAIQYIIESGLTLEEKGALGLLNDGEDTQLVAERAEELFGERGGEMTRAMAIGILGTDASETSIKIMDAALSHLFAFETGVTGGVVESQMIGFNAVRDLWSAVATPFYTMRLGEGYTLDQACEIDPMLRGLTAAVDKGNALTGIASPDMSSFNYGSQFTQFITKSAIDQKMSNFYAPVGKNIVSSALEKLHLGSLPDMLVSDSKLKRTFGKIIDATAGSTPWMLRSMSQNAQAAREMEGVSESQAIKYGMYSGVTTGLIEGVIGQAYDGLLDKGSNVLTKGLNKLTKGGMDKLLQKNGVTYVTNLLQQAFSESMEELAEMPLDKVGRSSFLGQQLTFTNEDMKETWDNMKLSFVSSLFTSAFFGLSADQGTKLYTDSEKMLDRIVNGQASVDQMMEYAMIESESVSQSVESADAEAQPGQQPSHPNLISNMAENGNYVAPEVRNQIESNYAVRDSVRIMQENQAAMDEAAVEMAAEEVVREQIEAGALKDINGDASANMTAIRAAEADLQTSQQKIEQYDAELQQNTEQKRVALYNMISNGISPEKGAARQMIHNIDEAASALMRKRQLEEEKYAEKETEVRLKYEEMQAKVKERTDELKAEAQAQVQKKLIESRRNADQLIRDMQHERLNQKTDSQEEKSRTTEYHEDEIESFADQIIGVETDSDPYEFFSAKNKQNPEFNSQQEANYAAHHAGTDIQPDAELNYDGDGYWPIDYDRQRLYEMIIEELPKEGYHLDKESLIKLEWDGDNRQIDPLAQMTNRALVTVARTADGEHVLVKDTERANQKGSQDAYLLMKRPDVSKVINESSVNTEAQHIMDSIDIRLNELNSKAAQLKEQGIYGVDIDQTEERIDALRKLRQQASSYIFSGQQRALIGKLNDISANGKDNRIGTQEIRGILESLPEINKTGSFNLDDFVIGRYTRQKDAMLEITRMGKRVQKVSGGKATTRASIDLLNAIPDPEQFIYEMKSGQFDLEAFAQANPKLFGAVEDEGEKWKPEDLSKRYDSKLSNNNPNYIPIDSSNGFNLVVKSNRVRLDANDTGKTENVNAGIHTVSDAIRALQKELTTDADQIADERAKNYSRKHDPMRLIYTTYDEQGNPVNRTYQDYTDPKTGEKRIPTINELQANSSRITVNWVRDWQQANPNEQTTGKKRPKTVPAEKLEFTLERSDLAPNAYDPQSPNASRILVQSDLRRAEADYEQHIGMNGKTPTTKLRYFTKVCEANVNSYLQAINQISGKVESGKLTDAELHTAQQNMDEYASALQSWQYASDRVNQMLKSYSRDKLASSGIDKTLKQYDELLKKTGNASMEARLQIASSVRQLIQEQYQAELEASIPKNATLQTLIQQEQDVQNALEEIMNARNQAAVLNHASPSAMNSEPLAQAAMEELDTIHQQMELIADQPRIDSTAQNEAPVPEIENSTVEAEEVEGSDAEVPQNGAQETRSEPAEKAAFDPDDPFENDDLVVKHDKDEAYSDTQNMDRAYLEAIVSEPEMIDPETGEVVNKVDELTGSEYVDAETGEVQRISGYVPAEDMSYATPVEEYMERAGLVREYSESAITDPDTHEQAERQVDAAYQAVKALTDRIDEIQTALQSGAIDDEQAAAIQTEKLRYIDERNRIKATAKRMDTKVSNSDYYSRQTIKNIARHCLETGNVDWESAEVRARDINTIYENDLSRMRSVLQSKLAAGKTTALTIKDVAEIIGSSELDRELRMRHDVGFELSKNLHALDEALQAQQQEREDVLKQIEEGGKTVELEAALGRIDEEINTTNSMIDNGQKTMRMYFDSGSELSLEDILSGKGGGRLPLNVMNHVYAILKDIDAHSKNTNCSMNVLSHADNPLRTMEYFTGEWAPVMNALYIAQTQTANAQMNTEHGKIVEKLQHSGLKHAESENAMLYAEGKMTEEQFKDAYPNPADRDRIKKAIVEYRDVYDTLYKEVNQALIRNGFDPIPYRKNYIHHMRDAQSGIAKACAMLGIHITEDELPTSLAGHTEETKPRRGFMSAAMERHGDDTSYDLERNTMAYVNAAMRVIHHTDNISRLRQLEGIMDQTQNKRAVNSGLAQYSEVVNTNDLKRPGRSSKTAFSSMREWITEYTNLLAGKQSFIDRLMEKLVGRNGLQIANGLKNMTGSSIVVGNLNIATSNILPVLTMAGISPVQTAAALADVVRSGADGMRAFEAQSEFLTARYADQQFNMNWTDTAKGIAMIPFEAIDRFAANTVVRAYQKIGLKKGWTPEVAMKWADQMAWRMMASTNTGEGANIMSSKTAGILLQFSREGINNLQFLAHDLPEISSGSGDWLKKLMSILLGGWLYNYAFNKTTALEPITPTMQSIREWDSENSVLENLGNAAGNYAEMLNPTNLGTGSDLTDLPLVSNLSEMGQAVWNTASSASELNGEGVRDGLTDFFCATLGFVPGGLSMERLANGVGDYYRGYTTDSDGNIKFTIDNDLFSAGSIHDAIFTLLLSSSGTKGGREYTRSGYQKMTKTQTEAFHSQKNTGMSNQDAFNSVMDYAEQTGNRNASAMVLPDWAAEKADTDWMKAVMEFGTGAYPQETPDTMKINGMDHQLTDEEKQVFVQKYRTAYRMYILDAMADGSSLYKAAEKAYSKAYSNFKKEMEE